MLRDRIYVDLKKIRIGSKEISKNANKMYNMLMHLILFIWSIGIAALIMLKLL